MTIIDEIAAKYGLGYEEQQLMAVHNLTNDAGTPIRRVPAAKMPRVRKGANALAWRAEAADWDCFWRERWV